MEKSTVRRIFALSACAVLTGGCAGARPIETQKAGTIIAVTTVQAFQEKENNGIPDSITSRFQVLLDEALYDENHFRRGPQLTIRWKITAVDEGNRAARYFAGLFGAGKGKMIVAAKFFDQKGHQVGNIQSDGHISMGAFGGSYQSVMSVCADVIAKYARVHFSGPSH
jgi:hypothetical protein